MKSEEIKLALLEAEQIIRSSEFENWRRSFVERHLDEFSFEEENKLSYTEIHREFEEEIERRIEEGLDGKFDIADFMRSLPAFFEGGGKNDNDVGKTLTFLLEVSDFEQFKNMMMVLKTEKNSQKEDQFDGVSGTSKRDLAGIDTDIEGMMEMVETLGSISDSNEWENCLTLDWMKIDKMPVPLNKRKKKSEIYLRGVWTMNLTFTEACDMMFSFTSRRKNWDTNFTSCSFPHGGTDRDEDVVISADLNFGYLVNLVMFGSKSGTKLITRNLRRWTRNEHGLKSVTYAMAPWNLNKNCVDTEHKLLSIKVGTISSHPTLPGKIVMTTLETNTMGGMPTWALHWMMRATAPSMMRSLESRYQVYTRTGGGKVVNTTPFEDEDEDAPRGKITEGKDDDEDGKVGEEKKSEGKSNRK